MDLVEEYEARQIATGALKKTLEARRSRRTNADEAPLGAIDTSTMKQPPDSLQSIGAILPQQGPRSVASQS